MDQPSVLAIVGDPPTLKRLNEVLGPAGYRVVTARTGAEALEHLNRQPFDAVVVDIRMPGIGERELLHEITEIARHNPSSEVLRTTGSPEASPPVQPRDEGSNGDLQKPLSADALRHRMSRIVERRFLQGKASPIRSRLSGRSAVEELVGDSPLMMGVKELIITIAPTDSPVLIEGETGTGKELVAVAIHRLSACNRGPFIPVNCGAIPPDLLESEFFGHVRGAFTGAMADTLGYFRSAHGGTLLLDEVAELPPRLQTKLLRVLDEKAVRPVGSTRMHEVNVRVIAATNRKLEEAMRDGHFRPDLFYRLNVLQIVMPPLREHKVDLPALVTHFLRQFNKRFGREVRGVTPDTMAALMANDFPGNVRELENLLERAYALGADRQLTAADLPALVPAEKPTVSGERLPTLAEVEQELILRALRIYRNDRALAARALGISRRTMTRRMKENGSRKRPLPVPPASEGGPDTRSRCSGPLGRGTGRESSDQGRDEG